MIANYEISVHWAENDGYMGFDDWERRDATFDYREEIGNENPHVYGIYQLKPKIEKYIKAINSSVTLDYVTWCALDDKEYQEGFDQL
jgi:hypothetical protein